MDVLLYLAVVFLFAIPVAYVHALFLRAGPTFFGSLVPRGPAPWPHGVQEDDPQSRWASRVPIPGPPSTRPDQPRAPLTPIKGRVGPGLLRRH